MTNPDTTEGNHVSRRWVLKRVAVGGVLLAASALPNPNTAAAAPTNTSGATPGKTGGEALTNLNNAAAVAPTTAPTNASTTAAAVARGDGAGGASGDQSFAVNFGGADRAAATLQRRTKKDIDDEIEDIVKRLISRKARIGGRDVTILSVNDNFSQVRMTHGDLDRLRPSDDTVNQWKTRASGKEKIKKQGGTVYDGQYQADDAPVNVEILDSEKAEIGGKQMEAIKQTLRYAIEKTHFFDPNEIIILQETVEDSVFTLYANGPIVPEENGQPTFKSSQPRSIGESPYDHSVAMTSELSPSFCFRAWFDNFSRTVGELYETKPETVLAQDARNLIINRNKEQHPDDDTFIVFRPEYWRFIRPIPRSIIDFVASAQTDPTILGHNTEFKMNSNIGERQEFVVALNGPKTRDVHGGGHIEVFS